MTTVVKKDGLTNTQGNLRRKLKMDQSKEIRKKCLACAKFGWDLKKTLDNQSKNG